MTFTAQDLRYRAEQTYPALYAYLEQHARRYLGPLKFDANEVEAVVDHVIEQLVKMGLFDGGDRTPLTILDQLSNAQFYAFLKNSVKHKAIDRRRKRHLDISSFSELESREGEEGVDDPLNELVEPLWGVPLATPEEITLRLASQHELRKHLVHCLLALKSAPKQLLAMIQELQEFDATALFQNILEKLHDDTLVSLMGTPIPHESQHKDHAHKKLRRCLQQQSTNLTVRVALRLTEYGIHSANEYIADIQSLAQDDLSADDVRVALHELVAEGFLDWQGEDLVHITPDQMKRLAHYYRDE